MSNPHARGRFITLEGIDGAGKSTHLPWLKEVLERGGRRVWISREPGGTDRQPRPAQRLPRERTN